jgi:hypothetical protein
MAKSPNQNAHPLFSRHDAPVDKIIDNFPANHAPRPKVPPLAPAPTYGGRVSTTKRPDGGPSPLGRLIKFVRGDYTK